MASVYLSYDTSGVAWTATWSGANVIGITVELYEGSSFVTSQSDGFPAGTASWSGGFSHSMQYDVQYGVWVYLYAEPWTFVDSAYGSFVIQPPAPTKGLYLYANGGWNLTTPCIYTTRWQQATGKIYNGGWQ